MASFTESANPSISRFDSSITEPTYGSEDGQILHRDDDSEQCPAVSWMLRVRSKNDELKKFFGLPPNENLLEEYHCALRWQLLLQGRMYVFERNVCFYSNVFGYVKKKVIALQSVTAVKKKTHCRFPNSVELVWSSKNEQTGMVQSHRDFFTSFLSRDDAFHLITNAWHQCSGQARGEDWTPVTATEDDGGEGAHLQNFRRRALSVDVAGLCEAPGPDSVLPSSISQSGGGGKKVNFTELKTPKSTRRIHSQGSEPLKHTMSDISGSVIDDKDGMLLDGGSGEDNSDYDVSGGEEEDPWQSVSTAPPAAIHSDAKVLVTSELSCSPRDFYTKFLSNGSRFLEDVHEAAGDRRVILSSWRREPQMGLVRDLSFVSPIKGAFANWGAQQTQCYQTQRLSCHAGDVLVLETSQVIQDIPYGDCFTVEMRWEVNPVPASSPTPQRCSLNIHLRVNFIRKCLFKSLIQSGTQKQSLEFFTDLIKSARQSLESGSTEAKLASKPMQAPGTAPISEAAADPAAASSPLPPQGSSPLAGSQPSPLSGSLTRQGSFTAQQSMMALGTGTNSVATIVVVGVAFLLQALLLLLWFRPSPAKLQTRSVDQWLQQLAALKAETSMLQSRMDIVAAEAAHAMAQLQKAMSDLKQ